MKKKFIYKAIKKPNRHIEKFLARMRFVWVTIMEMEEEEYGR